MNVVILVSAGELVDKITILEIKKERIRDRTKLRYINKELKLLQTSLSITINQNKKLKKEITGLKKKLFSINTKLWNIENSIRRLEANDDFGKRFVILARSVYQTNDKRSAIKNEINLLFGSSIKEVKEYAKY